MNPIVQQLDDYLNLDFNDDHWSDDACQQADDWACELSPADWDELAGRFPQRSSRWRQRLYSSAGMVPPEERLPFILATLPYDRELDSMEGLRECLQTLPSGHPLWKVTAELRRLIEQAVARQSGYGVRFLREVLARLA